MKDTRVYAIFDGGPDCHTEVFIGASVGVGFK